MFLDNIFFLWSFRSRGLAEVGHLPMSLSFVLADLEKQVDSRLVLLIQAKGIPVLYEHRIVGQGF